MQTSTDRILRGVVVGCIMAGVAAAGNLTPPGSPGPTMRTLDEIYQQLAVATQQVAVLQQQVSSNQLVLADLQSRLAGAGYQITSGDMVLIPAGTFRMGATTNAGHEGIADAVPQHTVFVSAFYMDKNVVTSNLWREVYVWATSRGYAFANSGLAKGYGHPVHTVSWLDAIAWCNARSQRDGFTPCYTNAGGTVYTNSSGNSFTGGCNWGANGYRLPTEAEWEKAARGGVSDRRFPWADANTIQHARANYSSTTNDTYDTSSTRGYHPSFNSGPFPQTSPVGSFAPNGYGLYDMAGNISQWCWDVYEGMYYASSPSTDPRGPNYNGATRVQRGGGWLLEASAARAASRYNGTWSDASHGAGFRCARGL